MSVLYTHLTDTCNTVFNKCLYNSLCGGGLTFNAGSGLP